MTVVGKFSGDSSGNVAPLFGLLMVPMIFMIGLSVDFSRAYDTTSKLQSAADGAAIGVARATAVNNSAATSLGDALVAANTAFLPGDVKLSHSISVSDNTVTVTANGIVPTIFLAMVSPSLKVSVKAVASVPNIAAPLCVLGLNANAPDTVMTWGSANLSAPSCAVQSNSSSQTGLNNGGSAIASAAIFCTAASAYGGQGYTPPPAVNCGKVADPYLNKYTPSALSNNGVNVYGYCDQPRNLKVNSALTFDAGGPTNTYLFCGGVTVNAGATVTFKPGVYVFYSQFLVSSNATVNAPDGVTFYFGDGGLGSGVKDGFLTIQGGGNVNLVAPKSGPLAGVAIVQPLVSTYNGGATPAITNTITGSGTLNITGVIYTPQAQLLITGNGDVNTGTDYFGMVADFVTLQGNGSLNIGANGDSAAASMPAMSKVTTRSQRAVLIQ